MRKVVSAAFSLLDMCGLAVGGTLTQRDIRCCDTQQQRWPGVEAQLADVNLLVKGNALGQTQPRHQVGASGLMRPRCVHPAPGIGGAPLLAAPAQSRHSGREANTSGRIACLTFNVNAMP